MSVDTQSMLVIVGMFLMSSAWLEIGELRELHGKPRAHANFLGILVGVCAVVQLVKVLFG